MNYAIEVENLSKQYHIGVLQKKARVSGGRNTLREAITEAVAGIWRRGKRPDPAAGSSLDNGHAEANKADERDEATIWALKGVSFTVEHGEVVGVIGANGSGKSTLLKILAEIVEPTAGRARIYGRVGSLLEVGTGFHPELTGRENIYLNGAILGMGRKEIERKFDSIVAFSEIERFLDTPVKRYSSGMYVRLAFAVAAHLDPDILLVDEVLSVGDQAFQRKCLGKMDEVADSGRTVVFISHDMGTVQQLCTRTILLARGKVVHQGKTESTIAKYIGNAVAAQVADGVYDLSYHGSRSPLHDPILRRVVLHAGDGRPRSSFFPEEKFVTEMTLEPVKPIRHPEFAMAIEDSLGRRITSLATHFQVMERLPVLYRPCRVQCTLPQLRLGPGTYFISPCVCSRDTGNLVMVDGVLNAIRFEVGWRNSYGTGEPYNPIYGPVLTASAWELSG